MHYRVELLFQSKNVCGIWQTKGWEREIPATDTDNPPEKSMDGFVEVTEQMELPF